MTTNDLVAALQETLSRYQQNGNPENDSTQQLESQLADLKATVAHLQETLRSAQDEKRLLLETLSEQSQQLSRLTQIVVPGAVPASQPAVGKSPLVAEEAIAPPSSEEVKAPTKSKPKSQRKKTETEAAVEKATPAPTAKTSKAKAEPSRLDVLWDKVRDYNRGKPFPVRIKFDENLAMQHFGFTPQEWDAWYQGSNRAKAKRQPSQVRSNKRQAAKDAIETLKQQWVSEFPDSPLTAQVSAPPIKTAETEPETTPEPSAQPAATETSASASDTPAEAIAPPPKGDSPEDNLNALLQLFQSWNQNEANPSVRLTPYTATNFGIDVQQAREWMESHQEKIDRLNEGVPPNNRREARQALNRLKETWALV